VSEATVYRWRAQDRAPVWFKRGRCCGAPTTLATATAPPPGKEFRLVHGSEFELYLPSSLTHLPDELHLEFQRFPRRVDAYWNGCAWVV
jgi:hypothetical protein